MELGPSVSGLWIPDTDFEYIGAGHMGAKKQFRMLVNEKSEDELLEELP